MRWISLQFVFKIKQSLGFTLKRTGLLQMSLYMVFGTWENVNTFDESKEIKEKGNAWTDDRKCKKRLSEIAN